MFKEAFEEILSFEEYPSNIHFLEGANLQDIENIHSYKSEKFRISLSRAQQIYGSGRNGLYLNTAQEMADSELRYTLVCSVNVSSSARIYSDKIFFSRPSEEVETGNEIYIARDLDQIFTFLSEENSAPENSGSDLLPPASKN
ncbi:hypothetical protein Z948_3559 [Sulfitobacter donghicola DSW-25 = KCTC 12864 = JCM 14565]|nr:hypothetical protein Z948_3559 [Sulfitobacter donghicola DSW-25 = KCTC 12864 = JCM 14565]